MRCSIAMTWSSAEPGGTRLDNRDFCALQIGVTTLTASCHRGASPNSSRVSHNAPKYWNALRPQEMLTTIFAWSSATWRLTTGFLDDFMFKIPGIRHVRTNTILKEVKYEVTLPF
jgi:hypothetical protein